MEAEASYWLYNYVFCRFDLLVIASAMRVNIPDVQNVPLSWFPDTNELKSTIYTSVNCIE